jgi:hypothetical protein
MKKLKCWISRGLVLALAVVLSSLAACQTGGGTSSSGPVSLPGFVTGGGWIGSADEVPGHHANFGFNGEQCDLNNPPTGHFNFHDMSAPGYPGGVKINGTLADATLCETDTSASPGAVEATQACQFCATLSNLVPQGVTPQGVYGLDVNYRSTNPRYPGVGAAIVCVADDGEGFNAAASDGAAISITTGPFTEYTNQGPVQGNVQAHPCDADS